MCMKARGWLYLVTFMSALGVSACLTGREPEDCGGLCGVNATCVSASAVCACDLGWSDCNGDIGRSGGNGCECDSSCDICNGSPDNCSPGLQGACGTDRRYCDSFAKTCRDCAVGRYDCDGLGGNGCESATACGGTGCDPQNTSACPSQAQYCDSTELECTLCPLDFYDCDGYGFNRCESRRACDFEPCSVSSKTACSGEGYYCDQFSGECERCGTNTWNCDGIGGCESSTGCDVVSCDSACFGDYECVKDYDGSCVECLRDSHCDSIVNPGTLGPRCRSKECTCDNSIPDCSGLSVGLRCIDSGYGADYCGCERDLDCLGALICGFGTDECS